MFQSIQVCRAIAALMVVLFHLGQNLSLDKYVGIQGFDTVFCFGDAGVFFFFVLSGFIIYYVHADDIGHPDRGASYAFKRLARIYPTYWILFCAVFAAGVVLPTTGIPMPQNISTFIASLALIPQDAKLVGGTGAPVIIVAWSLQYELVFYLIFGSLIVNRTAFVLLIALLIANAVFCSGRACGFPQSFLSSGLMLLFGQGVLVAYLCKCSFTVSRPAALAAIGAFAFAIVALSDVFLGKEALPIERSILYGFAASVLIFGLVRMEQNGVAPSKANFFVGLGDASYSLYLIHFPLIAVLCRIAKVMGGTSSLLGGLISFPIILSLCVLSSVGFYRFIERPLLVAINGIWLNRNRRVATAQ